MKKKPKSKKKTVTRVIAAILIIVLAGVASYHGSKAIFTYKFRRDREAAEQKEQEEIANSIQKNYITVIRIGRLSMIRILNTDSPKLSFILMRTDSDLFTFDENGNGEDITRVVNNIQNAYGITVNSYEDFEQTAFADFINNSDSFECDLPYNMSFKDTNKMTVHMEKGEHILNGGQAWGVISGNGTYESQEEYIANVEAVLEGMLSVIFDKPTTDSLTEVANLIFDNCTSDATIEDVQNYLSVYAQLSMDDITITEFEGEETSEGFEVDIDKAKDLISDLLSETAATDSNTTEKTTEATKEANAVSSKDKSIYIRNAAYINGLASKWRSELTGDGYQINSVDNYDETYDQTIIQVKEKGMGQDLKKKYFKNAKIEVGNVEDGADICIYLGKDADTL